MDVTSPFSVRAVLPRERRGSLILARALVWIFKRVVYPLGGRGYTRIGRALLGRKADAVAVFGNGGRFVFPPGDGYYSHILLTGENYEDDVAFILTAIYSHATPYFLDCGANFGYWSSAVSSVAGMSDRVAGVEPSRHALPFLTENQAENGGRFRIEHLAIWDVAGQDVGFAVDSGHESSHIAAGASTYTVRTTTVDALVEQLGWTGEQVVVKLDVEGAEIAAFTGAAATSRAGGVFVYEDHGRDRESLVTRFLLERDWTVYFCADDGLVAVTSAEQLVTLKKERWRGYNLVAWRAETKLTAHLRSLADTP